MRTTSAQDARDEATGGKAQARRVLQAVLLVMLAALTAIAMHSLVRVLAGTLHPFQIAFLRFALGIPILLPFVLRAPPGTFGVGHLKLHALRSTLNTGALLCFFFALTLAPLTQVVALNFTAPLFASVIGILALGERIRLRRTLGLVAGFVGMLIILRPDIGIGLGAALTLAASLFWASAMVTIKLLGRTESSLATTLYASLFISAFTLPLAVWVWRTPSWEMLGLLVIAAMMGTLAQISLTQAFRMADIGLLMPFDYTKLIWAAALGWLVFSETPDLSALVGGAIILASTCYIAWRESRTGKPPPPPQD